MATNTYVALKTTTVGTAVPSVTFDNIPQGYTDLILVSSNITGETFDQNFAVQVGNGTIDANANYACTGMYGNGTSALSWRAPNNDKINVTYATGLNTQSTGITHFIGYSNTSTFKTVLSRAGGTGGTYNSTEQIAGLWRSFSAINTIKIYSTGTTFAAGSTFSLYGVKAWAPEATPKATGGYVYEDSTYWYHAFPFSSTFTPNQSLTCDLLVIAGGGGGGGGDGGGGGGGAGGYRAFTSQSVSVTDYAITVGAGGAGGATRSYGTKGGNSTALGFSASGGGQGGYFNAVAGTSGGSGGGGGSGGSSVSSGGAGNAGSYSPVEGYAGGQGAIANGYCGGGGGGASAVGSNATSAVAGNGGVGTSAHSSWGVATQTGQNIGGLVYYAGGGAGGANSNGTAGVGGLGGGGNGSNLDSSAGGSAGLVSSGGGGGGGGGNGYGDNGGSGLVIVRYAKA